MEDKDIREQLRAMGVLKKEETNKEETDLSQLLYAVADLGGTASLDACLDYLPGLTAATIAVACEKPAGDKRQQPFLKMKEISGVDLLILTSKGWDAVGRTSKREQKPDAKRLAHSLAPQRISGEMRGRMGRLRQSAPAGVEIPRVSVKVSATALTDFANKCVSAAWGRLQDGATSDAGGLVGQLTQQASAPRPDALIIEEWSQKMPVGGAEPWVGLREWDSTPPGTVVELTFLLEVETADKNTDALKDKVRRLNAAMDLGVADCVIWALDDLAIGHRLWRRVIAEDPQYGYLRHRFVPLNTIDGSGGLPAPVPTGSLGWWISEQ